MQAKNEIVWLEPLTDPPFCLGMNAPRVRPVILFRYECTACQTRHTSLAHLFRVHRLSKNFVIRALRDARSDEIVHVNAASRYICPVCALPVRNDLKQFVRVSKSPFVILHLICVSK